MVKILTLMITLSIDKYHYFLDAQARYSSRSRRDIAKIAHRIAPALRLALCARVICEDDRIIKKPTKRKPIRHDIERQSQIKVNRKYSSKESPTPKKILDELRRLHDEFAASIDDIEDDPEDASSDLLNIYAEMENQLDALEDAFGGE